MSSTQTVITAAPQAEIRLSDVVSALSFALDLTEGQPMGHAVRSCMIGMRLGEMVGLDQQQMTDLYYALLLKDSGCSSNSARLCQIMGGDEIQTKREVKLQDWTRPSLSGLKFLARNTLPEGGWMERSARMVRLAIDQKKNNMDVISTRCERGADIARKIGFTEGTAQAIRSLDEHWNGAGYPNHLQGEEIPILARILNISQTLEVYEAEAGPEHALDILNERKGRWFDPQIVRAAQDLRNDSIFWTRLHREDTRLQVLKLEPGAALAADDSRIDSICEAFAEVIDAKSPYTFRHSMGVAEISVKIARGLELAKETIVMIRRAALLHDLGKLGVSNSILDKPGKLTDEEFKAVKLHPYYTVKVIERIAGFQELAFIAGAHHEKLDGTGYFAGLTGEQLPLPARVIAVADVYQALTEDRPYRAGLGHERAVGMIGEDCPTKLDSDCLSVLKAATN